LLGDLVGILEPLITIFVNDEGFSMLSPLVNGDIDSVLSNLSMTAFADPRNLTVFGIGRMFSS
jgi:hypothetical protein